MEIGAIAVGENVRTVNSKEARKRLKSHIQYAGIKQDSNGRFQSKWKVLEQLSGGEILSLLGNIPYFLKINIVLSHRL